MIHSARSTIPPVAITIFTGKLLFCTILKSGDGHYGRTCENNDHYQIVVGRVDQNTEVFISFYGKLFYLQSFQAFHHKGSFLGSTMVTFTSLANLR